jgi:HK97 family phage major capsid protein
VPTLRRHSVLANAGAQVVTLPYGALGVASFSTPLAASWLAAEGDAASESDPVVARAAGSPKMLATPPVDVSRSLLKQAGRVIEPALATEIVTAIGKGLDAAAVNGTGADGQPTGALVASGTISQSGTSLAHAGLVAMVRQVIASGSSRERIRWFCDPLAFATLAGRERASGSGYMVDDFRACGLPVDVTEGMPNNSLLCMDAASIVLVLWGGVEVRANPFAASASGAMRFDCMVAADIVIPVAGRIAKSTTIT